MKISNFRKKMKTYVIIMTVIFLGSMVIGGIFTLRNMLQMQKQQIGFEINGEVINKMDVEREKIQIANALSKIQSTEKDMINILGTNNLIIRYLGLEMAKEFKINISSKEIEQEFQQLELLIPDKQQLKRYLENQGYTAKTFKIKIKEDLLIQKVLEKFVEKAEATPEEIDETYERYAEIAKQSGQIIDKEIAKEIVLKNKGYQEYQNQLSIGRKAADIKNVSDIYENFIEKTQIVIDGFEITNFEIANRKLELLQRIPYIDEETFTQIAIQTFEEDIKIVNAAKNNGIKVDERLMSAEQIVAYKQEFFKSILASIDDSDEKLLGYFEKNKSKYDVEGTADIHLVEIELHPTAEDFDTLNERAENLIKLLNVENFDRIGKNLNDTRNDTIYKEIKIVKTDQDYKDIEDAAFSGEEGKIFPTPIKTSEGYALIFIKKRDQVEGNVELSYLLLLPNISEATISEKITLLEKAKENVKNEKTTLIKVNELHPEIPNGKEYIGLKKSDEVTKAEINKELINEIFEIPKDEIKIKSVGNTIYMFRKVSEEKAHPAVFEESKSRVKVDYLNEQMSKEILKHIS